MALEAWFSWKEVFVVFAGWIGRDDPPNLHTTPLARRGVGIARDLDNQQHLPRAGRMRNKTEHRRGNNHLEGEAAILKAGLGLVSRDESHPVNVEPGGLVRNEKVFIFSN